MDRASVFMDSLLGIFIAVVAAVALDWALPMLGVENSFSSSSITSLFDVLREGGKHGHAAIFITSANGQTTFVEAQDAPSGTYTDPYTGATLAGNQVRVYSGSVTATINGAAQALPLTIVAGSDGSFYAPPTGMSTPCTTITLTLTYTAETNQSVQMAVPCGGS